MKFINSRKLALLAGLALAALVATGCAMGSSNPYGYGGGYGGGYGYSDPYSSGYYGGPGPYYGSYSGGYGDPSYYNNNPQWQYEKNQQKFAQEYWKNKQTFDSKYQQNRQKYIQTHPGKPVPPQ